MVDRSKVDVHAKLLSQLADAKKQAGSTNTEQALLGLALDRAAADDAYAKKLAGSTNAEQALLGLALGRPGADNKDYEKRLAQIEKTLERILNMIERGPSSGADSKNALKRK